MTRLAIGSTPVDPSGVLAMVTTYAFFDSQDHTADEDAFFEELSKARAARDLSPPRRHRRGADMTAALQRIANNELTSGDALQEALVKVSSGGAMQLRGWVVETSDLALVPTDEALLGDGDLDVEIGITHYEAEGGAWGQYVVLLLFTVSDPASSGRRASLD